MTAIPGPASLPTDFPLSVQGGMLEALGINMYTTIGKCLVEFVANAFDGDAKHVNISIPVDEIQKARSDLRANAKKEVKEGSRDPFKVLLTPLPTHIAVVIEDDGHGMSPQDIEKKFLPLNRKRRDDGSGNETNLKTEGGERHVMGRKGLGKLAGFGAAVTVSIRTKRKGEGFATTFVMDYTEIERADDLANIRIPATYETGLNQDEHGTRITLSGLKADAVKHSIDTITHTISEAFFGIEPEQMEITINGSVVKSPAVDYEFIYPDGASKDKLAERILNIDGIIDVAVQYMIAFRPRGEHLPVSRRGARIYCNGRLAAGPSLFDLPTGMHNFHSQSYMECIVRADDVDRHGVDLVNTNRTQLRHDNEVVRTLITFIEEQMKAALSHHAKWREDAAERELDTARETQPYVKIIDRLPAKTKASARKMLKTLGTLHGYESEEFKELAPLMVDTMNAGQVLIRLTELGHDPKSLQVIAGQMAELAEIEKNDALKLYRGRRSAIRALTSLIDRGEYELWKKKGVEKDLHNILKSDPWLIKPEYSRYLTSDVDLTKVSTALAKHLEVDAFAPLEDATRPDLVFVMADSSTPHVLNVVELKSPSIPLDNDHLTQLETYMAKITRYAETELGRPLTVHGFLIGAMPDAKNPNDKQFLLLEKIKNAPPSTKWVVLGVRSLLEKAMDTHLSVIKALESDLDDELGDGNVATPETAGAGAAPS
ncbi:ATP-binding protein [Pseudogemmobacter sonorensis]|uniref:ATP-binding protein n=1 Tax=Pseudogemmobacter sonorensis TaxID=2989681 RepID=UPI00368DAE48